MTRKRGVPASMIVAGGGPVGLSCAALVASAREDIEVRVVDAAPRARFDASDPDLRVYALSRASQRLLERLRVWDAIVERRTSPYRRMRVWHGADLESAAMLEFDAADIGEPDLGAIVEDGLLRSVLTERLERCPNVTLTHGVRITETAVSGRGVALDLDDGARARADLLVAADGVESRVRELLAMPSVGCDYEQLAIVAHVETAHAHAETAWQRFLPGGPLAFLPLADGRSSVVWSVPRDVGERLQAADADTFAVELEAASGRMLGAIGTVSERAAFPLRALHALRYTGPRVALAGDAAHAVHPLAGQGMNLGLLDAACLADVVTHAHAAGDAFADARVLRRYERRRKRHNLEMLVALDALNRLFRLPGWATPLRRAGLAAVNHAPPAKRALMSRALGLDELERAGVGAG